VFARIHLAGLVRAILHRDIPHRHQNGPVAVFVLKEGITMAAEISIRGQVRNYDGSPIFMIKVSVYRGARLAEHGYTDDEGYYSLSLPAGEPVTVRFDTHPTLNNSRMWHPSVIANLEDQRNCAESVATESWRI
jgi:hypothetical protein